MFGRLDQIGYKTLIWVLAISETIHNVEEAIWLPAWSQTVGGVWHPPVGAVEFRFAVTMITLIFYGIIYYYWKSEHTFARYLMGGALVMILINVFVPHLLGTLFAGHYAPGVFSGLILNLPITLYLLWRGLRDGVFRTKTLVLGSLIFIGIVLPLMPAFFAIGRYFESIS